MSVNTIYIRGEQSEHYGEELCGATNVLPGMLAQVAADGTIAPHGTAGANAERIIPIEDALQGRNVTTAYVQGDPVRRVIPDPGDELHLLLKGGQNAAAQADLVSNGDGYFKVGNGTTDVPLFRSLEAKNLTALASDFIKARRI